MISPEMQALREEVMLPREVADHFKVSRNTVNQWLNSGRLRGFRVSTHWRILARDLEAAISESTRSQT